MKLYWQGLYDLLKHYVSIFNDVWKVRKQLDTPVREADENAFRPAHLELIDTPVSALLKWIARLIMLFLLLAILWAWLGKSILSLLHRVKLRQVSAVKLFNQLKQP